MGDRQAPSGGTSPFGGIEIPQEPVVENIPEAPDIPEEPPFEIPPEPTPETTPDPAATDPTPENPLECNGEDEDE